MEKLKNCILNQISIDNLSLDAIVSVFEPMEISKGNFFLESGKTCRQMAFIASGYMRIYDIVDGKEITLWIGSSGKFITSLSSFVFETENHWNIQAVTDCTIYVINREDHYKLNKTEPKWLEFDNLLLANSFALLEKSMFSQLHTTAKQRFQSLLEEEPELFNTVPLQYIASMLGITPESLSRLRKLN
ncbi:cAMP-binding domain of CRP or a regulatory subunit of cAMP-dependent protein kinases [Maribacter aquivivus]|uniref:cAMP-binding domain of CRP or a regulatory subunit of cAMP-dependent protein kinases n=1 Tax=Maribacter aquivivus TaxID=228958 RepID=A0A1M6R4G7_9FLAO|nr:Crp/Fnr family transcriptional regulator [Maribacter aquivivus]SHK27238.1 cAMP-binding domain of CRP or a regulatory subunit of cAMP-dependent protein kinases [Maribacter aquivivus]